jgi:uncharacterized protein
LSYPVRDHVWRDLIAAVIRSAPFAARVYEDGQSVSVEHPQPTKVPSYRAMSGVLGDGKLAWLRSLTWMLLCLAIIAFVISLQTIVRSIGANPSLILAMAFVCTILAYLSYAGLVRWGERRLVTELQLSFLPIELVAGILIGSAAMFVVILCLWLPGWYSIQPGHWTDCAHDIREALGTGFLEELLARLVIFRLLVRAFGTTAGLIVSAAVFGAAHFGNDHATVYSSLAIAVEAGLMLASFYILTGRIWMSVGAHAGWNFVQGSVFGARVSGMGSTGSLLVSDPVTGASRVLTGGSFGPEASAPAICIGLLVFAGTLVLARRGRRRASIRGTAPRSASTM